jgi:hypothetical protein
LSVYRPSVPNQNEANTSELIFRFLFGEFFLGFLHINEWEFLTQALFLEIFENVKSYFSQKRLDNFFLFWHGPSLGWY